VVEQQQATREPLEIRRILLHHKVTTVETALLMRPTPEAVAAVEHLPLVEMERNRPVPEQAVTVAQARHQPFLAAALHTLAAVAQALKVERAVLVVLAAALTELETTQPLLLARLILAAAVAGVAGLAAPAAQAAQAALASLSSSTTSALPRSLPSSHRKSGLHQRVR
jgi:hypothetical protein